MSIHTDAPSDKLQPFAPMAAGLLSILFLYCRTSGDFHNPQFWAEDGVVFWTQQAQLGWKAILSPYAGYSHFVPRAIAATASLFDPGYAPDLFFAGYVMSCFWAASTAAASVCNPLQGILMGAGLMLAPIGLGEIFGTITNAQWIMAPPLALLLLPARFSLNRLLYGAIVSITGPFSVFLAPIAAYRFFSSRDIVCGSILLGAIIQIMFIAHAEPIVHQNVDAGSPHLFSILFFRPFMQDAICALLGIGVILASLQPQARAYRLVLLYFAIAVTAGTAIRYWTGSGLLDDERHGARYFYIPRTIMIWCAISIAFINWRNAALAVAFIGCLTMTGADNLKRTPLKDAGWRRHYQAGDAVIRINPDGWDVKIPGRF